MISIVDSKRSQTRIRQRKRGSQEELIENIKRRNSIGDGRNGTAVPGSISQYMIDSQWKESQVREVTSRQSLTEIANQFKNSAKLEKESRGMSKDSRWWDAYKNILKSDKIHKRKSSVPDQANDGFKLTEDQKLGTSIIESKDNLNNLEWGKTNYAFNEDQVKNTVTRMIHEKSSLPNSTNKDKFDILITPNKKFETDMINEDIKETHELVEFTKTLQTLGFANIWKEFYYPKNFTDIQNYIHEKDKTLIDILKNKVFEKHMPKQPKPVESRELYRNRPYFINAIMNEREQMVVLKNWVDYITNLIPSDADNIDKVKHYYLCKHYFIFYIFIFYG
jgi:hypothetical protein